MNRRLYRSRTDTVIGGVASGLAAYLNADPALIRIAWAILVVVTGGVALLVYIVAWIVVPEEPATPLRRPPSPRPIRSPARSSRRWRSHRRRPRRPPARARAGGPA